MAKQGEYELKLNENLLVLRCTPAALRYVETKHGGYRAQMQKLFMVEYSIIVDLIEAGLIGGKEYDKAVLEEEVFKAGTLNLVEPLSEYLGLLVNGGKPPVEGKETKGEG